MPAAMPITIAPTGPTKPDAGVMATRPATAPEQMPMTVGFRGMIHSTNIQVKPATAVAIWVTVIAMPACMPAVTAEPALKPNQPTHSSEAPMKVSTMLWPGPVVLALAEHDRAHQAGNAGIDVHHGAAGEVEHLTRRPSCRQEAVRPRPNARSGIDEDRPQAHEPQHRREFHALGEGAGDQRRRDDGEGHLEADDRPVSGMVAASGFGLPTPLEMSLTMPCRNARLEPPIKGEPAVKASL